MSYIDDSSFRGPSGPALPSGDWATFVAGDLVRCPSCHRGIGAVRGGVIIRVRCEQRDPSTFGLRYRCHKCGDYLEIRQVTVEERAA